LGKLEGKTVGIVVADEFEDVELLYPLLRLSEEGARIVLVPVPKKPVTGRFGTRVPIEVMAEGKRHTLSTVEDLDPKKIDCLLFPGGFSPDSLRLNEKVLAVTKEMNRLGKFVAAICHGPQVLISAKLVAGKKVTSYAAVRDDLINAGAKFTDIPAARDGNIITGRVPDDLPEFCQEIIKALSETS